MARGFKDLHTPFFVLAALGLPANHCQELDGDVTALKRRLVSWAQASDFEIKGRDLRRGEKLFTQSWAERAQAFLDIAKLIAGLPGRICAVRVDKRRLPGAIGAEMDLYRVALSRLLEEVGNELDALQISGMILFDSRSDLHSSVQDRRLIDAFREWAVRRKQRPRLVELPWFGFSAFYAGLQLADFCAYLVDFVSNERQHFARAAEVDRAFETIQAKLKLVDIP